MSITLHGVPPVGTKENPAVASFAIRNKETGAVYYWGGNSITFYHPLAESVSVSAGGGAADAVNRKTAATGSGLTSFGGKQRGWTSFSPLTSFHFLREPGTLTITVTTHDGEELTATAHVRPPTPDEMTAAFEDGRLNADLVELVSREDEAKAWDKSDDSTPEPEEDAETLLLSIEDTVERLRGLLG